MVSVACHSSIVPVDVTPVVPHNDVLGEFTVVVQPTDDHILIFVVLHDAPPVPTFTVLVVAVAVALVE